METAEETVTDPGAEQADEQPAEAEETETAEEEPEVPLEEPEAPSEPEPEPPAGMSIEELEKVRGQLDRSATTWRNRVSQLLGEEAQFLVPCELCDPMIPGFHWPAEMVTPTSDVQARLYDVLRAPDGPGYQPDPYTTECTTCMGLGKTLTKSLVAGKTERVCPSCGGDGFKVIQAQGTPPPQNGDATEIQYNLPNEEPLVVDGSDAWGSPKLLPDGQENPNWGRMPQYKNPTLP